VVVPRQAQDFVYSQLRRRARRPQLKRDPLGGNTFLSTRSAKGSRPNVPRFNEFSIDSMRWALPS